jgi:NADH:ubiquinone oxidoreductase subunit F (NADH-binding)
VIAARIVGADEIFVAAGRDDSRGLVALQRAAAERNDGIALHVVAVPMRFVAGQETALVNWLNGGPAKPTVDRVFERGVNGRPTLVQNVETLANLALIARHGADWFRRLGTASEPGTALVTALGAVRAPGVGEIEVGMTMRDVLATFGGMTSIPQAFLVGGYFGTWVSARDALDLPFTDESLGLLGASLGARLLIVLPHEACGLVETARAIRYLERESAGQCGSCYFGLPAIATAFEQLAFNAGEATQALERLSQLVPQVEGRGACALPTGATRLVTSALRVFAQEVHHHRSGRCCGPSHPHVLPIPGTTDEWS